MSIQNEPQARTKALSLLQAALIGLATWWVYRPAFHAGWIWDDSLEIYGNYALRTARGLRSLWLAPPGLDYFPLKSTLQWVQWHLWQGNPGPYHATNVVLHFLNALLLWRVLGRLGIRHGWIGGLLFAVHPLAVESVAWVSEFKNVLSLTFLLLAMLAWLKYDGIFNRKIGEAGENTSEPFLQEGSKGREAGHWAWSLRRWHTGMLRDLCDLPVQNNNSTTAPSSSCKKWYFVSLLMFVLAMLSKSSVVMFPVVLLLYGWYRPSPAEPGQRRGAMGWKYLARTLPFFAVSLVLGLVTVWFQVNRAIERSVTHIPGLPERVAVAGKAIVFYLAKAVWPTRELPVYPRWELAGAAEWGWAVVFAGIGVALLMGLVVERTGSRTSSGQSSDGGQSVQGTRPRCDSPRQAARSTFFVRSLIFGMGVFVINLLPVIGLAPMAYQQISWVADHFVYLPLVGLVGMAAAGTDWVVERVGRVGAASLRGGATGLPRPGEAKTGPSGVRGAAGALLIAVALVVLAVHSHSYVRIFQGEKTLWTYTLERNRAAWIGYNNLGIALRTEGHPEEAIRDYEQSIRLRPAFAEAHNDLGVALAEQGKFPEALAQYEEAIREKPDMADTYNNEANLLQNMGRLSQAEARVRQALRLNPNFPEAHNDLGNVLVRRGHFEEAIQQYREALRLRPDFEEAMSNLGMTLAATGKFDQAIALYERALQLKPDYAQAHNNLGVLLQRAGRREAAIAQYRLALRCDPRLKEAQENLATLEGGR